MAIPPGPPNSSTPINTSSKNPLTKEEKLTRLQRVGEGKIPKAPQIVPTIEPVATPILAPKQSPAPTSTELKEKTVMIDKDVKKQRRLSGLFSSSVKKETGEPGAGKNEKDSAKASKNSTEAKSRPPTELKSKTPLETEVKHANKPLRSAENLQEKIQELIDLMKIDETVVVFQEKKSRLLEAKKNKDTTKVTNLSEQLTKSKVDDEGALGRLNGFLNKNGFKNFKEAETALLVEIKKNLVAALNDPTTKPNAVSTLGSFNDPSPQFIKMILSLEPKNLKTIMGSLAQIELDPKHDISSRPFRIDNLFTKLFREKVLSELGEMLKPLVWNLLQDCALGFNLLPPEEAARRFVVELRKALKLNPPSPELTKILNEIRELIQASPNYSKQSGIFLMNLFLLRGVNFLINNPESMGIVFSPEQRKAAAKATIALMDMANIETPETADSRLVLDLLPHLIGQESKAGTDSKP